MIDTQRMTLRGWRLDDLDPLSAIDGDPEVMRFIGDGSVRTRDQTAAAISSMTRAWSDHGFGIFAVELRATRELAGWVGLAIPSFLPEVLPAVEIGWRLARRFWGRGLATEAAQEALSFGFEGVGLDEIISICHIHNDASVRIMTKLGMRPDRVTTTPSGQPVRVLAINRSHWSDIGDVQDGQL
ncbi:GNAT family N-acetyltransferase [Microlunatus speluncae]|uniref:GNAT family N-acetyltransferase n=1 Tax=Microlunatus speluncae TaxID=2594267 RepID=UPI001266572B|nr:GNAT family N-acetyltransferase [Microlunatus speluncae]